MIGRTIGNYRIVEQIGMGGMATVYKAYDPDTDRYVAIKILAHHFLQDPTFRQRFQREAKAIAKLEHLHILPIFAYGEEDGIAYMVMRYLKAGTLTDRIRQGPLPFSEASRLLHQIAGALDHAHAHGVLHRDVKPSNVLLDADGNAFLTDFGIAKMVEATVDLTAGGILGTPAYMSPEQCQGNRELTPASDIFSLGIILYEMVTGRTPFQAETPIALIHMQLYEPMPPPCQLRPDLPEDGQRVILKALAREPESRYQTCQAMATAFDQALAQAVTETLQPVVAAPTVADDTSLPTSPAIEEATVLHKVTPKTAVVQVPFWRRIPGWAYGLIALLVIMGLIGGALAAGLIFTGQESASLEISVSEVASEPTLPADEAEVEAEIVPTPPGLEATAIPPAPVTPGEPPAEGYEVVPCDWHGLGPGLCITPRQGDQPRKILTEANLEITSPGSWSPDGQRIAFSAFELGGRPDRDQSIHIVNTDGAGLTELPTPNNDIQPAWSPDGEWLAFHSSGKLAVMRPDGSNFTVYEPPGGCGVTNPQWSPNSRSIVFYVIGDCDEWDYPLRRELWVVTTDGQTTIPIASFTDKNADCSWTEVAFSPDGVHVAYFDDRCRAWLARADGSGEAERVEEFPYWWTGMFHPQWGQDVRIEYVEPEESVPPPEPISTPKTVEVCEGTAPSQICIRNLETGQVTQITDNLEFGGVGRPSWSPDGQQLVFTAGSDPEVSGAYDHKLYTINADGSDLRQITHGEVNDVDPVWSPDGRWIAFHRNCGLWLIRPDGSEAQELVAGAEEFCAIGIAWKPDSRVIAFWNVPGDQAINRTIWVINRDGTGRKVIRSFEQPVEWGNLAWSPDGQHIVFWYEAGGQGQGLLINAEGRGEPEVIERYEEMPWPWFSWHWPPAS